ncbi:MAG: alternative ribosome rescue aminoacyl-tRNA hydrolase ArfB [Oligoflexales bacterium]
MTKYRIPEEEFELSFSRSSGAGGQNVNKVNTKATLEWDIDATNSLPRSVIDRFRNKFANKILENGKVVIRSQKFREQARNIADCIEKLHEMIDEVAVPPKVRRPTKPKKSAVEKRLQSKRMQSEKKKMRQEY